MDDRSGTLDDSISVQDTDDEDVKSMPKHSQSKDLVWLGPEYKVPLSQITDNMISTLIVTCSACRHQINHHSCKIYLHRHLNVIVCKRCYRYYGDGSFQKDSTGADEYCTWCAEGGSLLICDQCSRAFCKNCIRRNLTRRELSRVMALDTWHCYVCVPEQIEELVRYAQMIQVYAAKDRTRRRTVSPETTNIAADDAGAVEQTMSGVAEQLRLLASILESDVKKCPGAALKRATSLLRTQAKTVSEIADSIEHMHRKHGRSKVNNRGVGEDGKVLSSKRKATKPYHKNTEVGQGDAACVEHAGQGEESTEETKAEYGKNVRKALLNNIDFLSFLDVPDEGGREGGGEHGVERSKERPSEGPEKEGAALPAVEKAVEKIAPVVEVGTSHSEGSADEKARTEEGAIEADTEKGEAASAGSGSDEVIPDGDCLQTAVSKQAKDIAADRDTPVVHLHVSPVTTNVVSESDDEKRKQQGESEVESPSLLDELLVSVEDPVKEDGHSIPKAGNGTAQVGEKIGANEPQKVETDKERTENDSQEQSEVKSKDARVEDAEKNEDSSLSDGSNACASHVESESLKGSSESEASATPKSPSKRQSPRKRAPLTENEKARRALQRSLCSVQSDTSSSDDEKMQDSKAKFSPRVCKTTPPKRGRRPPLAASPSRESVKSSDVGSPLHGGDEEELHVKFASDDPKLSSRPVVVVNKLILDLDEKTDDLADPAKEMSVMLGGDSSEDEIARLLTMPGKTKARKAANSKAENKQGEKRAKKARKEKPKPDSGDSDCDKSSGSAQDSAADVIPCGQKSPPVKSETLLRSKNELSKDALLQSILHSSGSSDESEEDPLPTKKKPSKKQTEPKEDEEKGDKDGEKEDGEEEVVLESEEEVVTKKKSKKLQKYEKLLHRRTIHSDEATGDVEEENKKDQSADTKKRKAPRKRNLVLTDEDSSANDAGKRKDEESSSDESSLFSSSSSSSDSLSDFKAKKKKSAGTQKTRAQRKKRNESSSDAESEKPKKKRRRIRVAASTDKEGDSENDVEVTTPSKGTEGKGRKNIRKVLTDSELHKRTKLAAQAEEERKKRIRERQKLYNDVMGAAASKEHLKVSQLVLEMNTETKEVIVEVHPSLVQCMKPHQIKGVKFMYDCTIETVEMLAKDKKGSGAILAHCMGLGKTFQVVSFLHTILTNERTKKHLTTALVVCPYNTVLNWVQEFEHWLEEKDLDLTVHEISAVKDNYTRVDVLNLWHDEGGVLIMGYDKFRLLVNGKGKRFPSRLREGIEKTLLDPGPDIVICDEGHVLKNDTSGLSKAMSRIRTNRKIVLTGTPLQNNLNEYHCMVNFVKPNLLGTKKEFLNRFVNPIRNGQCADSTVLDVKIMKKRVHILHSLLDGCVQRCDYSALAPFLPPKCEYVISVRLSEPQVALYRYFLDNLARNKGQRQRIAMGILADYHILRNVWTHPYLLEVSAARAAAKEALEGEDDDDFINDDSTQDDASDKDEVICLDDPQSSTSKKNGKKDSGDSSEEEVVKSWHTRSRGTVNDDTELHELKQEQREKAKMWWSHIVPEEDMEKLEISGKMMLLCKILQECDAIGDKVLLFSQSLSTLDMIERMLHQFEERATAAEADPMALIDVNDPLRDCQNTWSMGIDYFRMDGSTSVDLRKRWIEMFNSEDNPRARLFLISTRAGSLGTNLVGANRVILMDASWNPTHDVQAIFRVYRFGQKKPVFIYRLLAQGTMEEKIYDRQVTKQSLSCRVVDEQQIERHFNAADLQELYSFDPDSKSSRPTPMVPKDRLLAELLIRHKEWIVTYHEHDSLLQNVTEEDLTEEERKIAWEEYNAEREGRLRTAAEEASAEFAEQQVPPNSTTGTGRQFTLNLYKIISDIRRQNPNITQEQLALHLRDALTLFRTQFRKQQMDAFNQRAVYLKYKQPVPQEVTDRLGESSMAIQQLNSALTQLDRTINAYTARTARGTSQQSTRMPNAAPQQSQQFQFMPRAAQQFARMQQSAWANQYRQYKQTHFQRPQASGSGAPIPIISEVEDITPPTGPAQKPPTSSVTITEIID